MVLFSSKFISDFIKEVLKLKWAVQQKSEKGSYFEAEEQFLSGGNPHVLVIAVRSEGASKL